MVGFADLTGVRVISTRPVTWSSLSSRVVLRGIRTPWSISSRTRLWTMGSCAARTASMDLSWGMFANVCRALLPASSDVGEGRLSTKNRECTKFGVVNRVLGGVEIVRVRGVELSWSRSRKTAWFSGLGWRECRAKRAKLWREETWIDGSKWARLDRLRKKEGNHHSRWWEWPVPVQQDQTRVRRRERTDNVFLSSTKWKLRKANC